MLLWKTLQSPSVRAESVRRKQPKTQISPRHTRQASERELVKTHDPGTSQDDEERYIFKLVLMMLLVLVLPAVLMLLYIFLNPDAFQYDITPKQDFSSWHPGKSL